ncbi:MAG: Hpt domain-containing protein [Cellvibrionaceae bacterium]
MTGSVDTETLTMLKEVMEDDFPQLITTYLDDATTRIAQLSDLVAAADYDELRHCAHSLKGSSSNLGAMPLSELCFEVETKAKDQQLDGIEACVESIKQEFDLVKSALQAL